MGPCDGVLRKDHFAVSSTSAFGNELLCRGVGVHGGESFLDEGQGLHSHLLQRDNVSIKSQAALRQNNAHSSDWFDGKWFLPICGYVWLWSREDEVGPRFRWHVRLRLDCEVLWLICWKRRYTV